MISCFLLLPDVSGKTTPPIDLGKRQILVIDADTNTVLLDHNANQQMVPSSMTKILTAYLIFEAIEAGQISLNTQFKISRKASKAEGSKMYLPEGGSVSVSDILQGLFVASGNDACICAAENIAESESAFVKLMNQKLQEFGCKDSYFVNATGLPDSNHYSTCFDLYKMAKKIYEDFPQYKKFFRQKVFVYAKGTHKSLNRALHSFSGADGLKTGNSKSGGQGVVISSEVEGRRVFAIINGCRSLSERNRYSDVLMNWAYRNFYQVHLFTKGQTVATLDTWMANKPHLHVVVDTDIVLTLPRQLREVPKAELVFTGPIEAPVKLGEKVGELHIMFEEEGKKAVYPAYAKASVQRAGYLKRLPVIVHYLIFGQNKL